MVLRLEAVNLNGEYCSISHYLVIQITGHIFQLSMVLYWHWEDIVQLWKQNTEVVSASHFPEAIIDSY